MRDRGRKEEGGNGRWGKRSGKVEGAVVI